ncbi:MAG: DUF6503 family protein [Flavobacteriaceae bacterium]
MLRFYFLLFLTITTRGQEISATTLLEKSIAYHDPNCRWPSFEGRLVVEMETPSRPLRRTELDISIPKSYFKYKVIQDGITTTAVLDKGVCQHWYEGETEYSAAIAEKYRLNCERTIMMRNYYTYLYGLPMKLRDPGTRLHPWVEKINFQGEIFYRLRVDYDEKVGSDRWYFYFDTTTYQLRHYQFYHDESQNDGEYILLEDEVEVSGMKLPKVRSWYTNAAQKYLGTDTLVND